MCLLGLGPLHFPNGARNTLPDSCDGIEALGGESVYAPIINPLADLLLACLAQRS